MPFPFIIVAGLAAAAGAVGIGKAVSASKDNSRAREINNEANDIIDDAKRKVNAQRDLTQSALEKLGKLKLQVLDNEVKDFLHYFRMIKNARLESSIHEGTLSGSNETLQDLTRLESFAASLATGSAAGLAGGALTAFAAYGATMTLATASTGTAIGALSGVAATNATLAWLGGGTLAAGGFGMAGGAALLGGLVAGPALLVLGLVSGSKAKANLDNARSNRAKAREIAEQLETACVQCRAISSKAEMFTNLLQRAVSYFHPLVESLKTIVGQEGGDWNEYSNSSQRRVAAAAAMAGTVTRILDTPILTKDGQADENCEKIAREIEQKLPQG